MLPPHDEPEKPAEPAANTQADLDAEHARREAAKAANLAAYEAERSKGASIGAPRMTECESDCGRKVALAPGQLVAKCLLCIQKEFNAQIAADERGWGGGERG